ncbi:MAG: DUF2505 domain-containing protein [Nevskia sp.]|nr:DUF2505 domain-containing protein [Nevskia sp.]
MTTSFEERQEFDQPRDKVLRMFSDRGYFERKYAAVGGWDIQVLQHETDGRRFRIKCSYHRRPGGDVPAFARKFIGDSVLVTQEDVWNLDTATGRLEIDVRNLPMRIGADMRLVERPGGCANVLQWKLHCPMPLIGGKLEQALAEEMRERAVEDLQVSRRLLATY